MFNGIEPTAFGELSITNSFESIHLKMTDRTIFLDGQSKKIIISLPVQNISVFLFRIARFHTLVVGCSMFVTNITYTTSATSPSHFNTSLIY